MRSFVAIELPESTRSAIAEFQQELKKSAADVRWIRPEGIHLTLKFLGEISKDSVDSIVAKLGGACKKYSRYDVSVSGVGVFPGIRSPRVLWVGVRNSDTTESLQNDVAVALTALGFQKEERKFVPHLTIGRFKSLKGKSELLRRIDAHKYREFGTIRVNALAVMKSELSTDGARYTRLAEISLGAAG